MLGTFIMHVTFTRITLIHFSAVTVVCMKLANQNSERNKEPSAAQRA